MNVISYKAIRQFTTLHPDSRVPLGLWYKTARKANWKTLVEVRQTYPSADLVDEYTVFNIGGNNYRLVVYINYQYQQVLIKHIMTHSEYDKDKWKT